MNAKNKKQKIQFQTRMTMPKLPMGIFRNLDLPQPKHKHKIMKHLMPQGNQSFELNESTLQTPSTPPHPLTPADRSPNPMSKQSSFRRQRSINPRLKIKQ